MTRISALPALMLAAGLALAPSLSQARDLLENTNNASATGSPFAYSMQVTRSHDQRLPLVVGNSAAPSEQPASVAATTTRHAPLPLIVGNSAGASNIGG
ncbi:glycosyl transferase family 39 [Roseomonas sp. 18066]|uniref:glycosyl transferase family 39 n=1 Tax=Roseomonas sp. 18066 TaxID=2681412 RepID=UPI00135B5794|nr:glycosyl transferase family 39 [Roseomonas sp. 18066]